MVSKLIDLTKNKDIVYYYADINTKLQSNYGLYLKTNYYDWYINNTLEVLNNISVNISKEQFDNQLFWK